MQYRLDPLEERAINVRLETMNNPFWIIGDSRAKSWDTSFLQILPGNKANLAIEGQTTKQVLERFKNDLEISHPNYMLVQVGINDLKSIGFLRDPTITQNCIDNTKAILELCKKNNIVAIYTTIFPVGDIEIFRKPLWSNNVYDSINKVNNTLKQYCSDNDIHFFDAYALLLDESNSPTTAKIFQKDFLHLNEDGYQHLGKELSEAIRLDK